jgi:hypothetical protein
VLHVHLAVDMRNSPSFLKTIAVEYNSGPTQCNVLTTSVSSIVCLLCATYSVDTNPRYGFGVPVETLVTWYVLSIRMVHLLGSLRCLLLYDNMDISDVIGRWYSVADAVSQMFFPSIGTFN